MQQQSHSRRVGLYLTFQGEEIRVILWKSESKEILSDWKIPLLKIVPSLVESLEKELIKNESSFKDLSELYLTQKPSRWNSNRLVSTFVKTLAFALSVNIYVFDDREVSNEDIALLEGNYMEFLKFLQAFRKVDWKELKPLYNSCPITNT